MKAIILARRKPVQVWSPADIGLNSVPAVFRAQQVAAPKQRERQRVVIEGDGEVKQMSAFVEHPRKNHLTIRGCYEQIFQCLGIQRYPFSSARTDEWRRL